MWSLDYKHVTLALSTSRTGAWLRSVQQFWDSGVWPRSVQQFFDSGSWLMSVQLFWPDNFVATKCRKLSQQRIIHLRLSWQQFLNQPHNPFIYQTIRKCFLLILDFFNFRKKFWRCHTPSIPYAPAKTFESFTVKAASSLYNYIQSWYQVNIIMNIEDLKLCIIKLN